MAKRKAKPIEVDADVQKELKIQPGDIPKVQKAAAAFAKKVNELNIPNVQNGMATANDHERRLCIIELKLGLR